MAIRPNHLRVHNVVAPDKFPTEVIILVDEVDVVAMTVLVAVVTAAVVVVTVVVVGANVEVDVVVNVHVVAKGITAGKGVYPDPRTKPEAVLGPTYCVPLLDLM
jgi:hypothetical protein